MLKKTIFIPDDFKAYANQSIVNDSDPMHQIDVLLQPSEEDGSKLTAIEVKFGESIVTPGAYCKRYLSQKSEGNKGNMINKLIDGELEVEIGKVKFIVGEKWILLVRNNSIKGKLEKKTALSDANRILWQNMRDNCIIISLEELLVGVEISVFEDAVTNCLKTENSYHKAWNIAIMASSQM